MKWSPTTTIGLIADLISLGNFAISITPIVSINPQWYVYLTTNLNNEFRFIIFTVITLASSYLTSKMTIYLDRALKDGMLKMTIAAMLTAIFAWIVVFNVRVITFKDNLEGSNTKIFLATSLLFLFFSSVKIHRGFKDLGYERYKSENIMSMIMGTNYTPIYLRKIRVVAYWFVIIVGGFYYKLKN